MPINLLEAPPDSPAASRLWPPHGPAEALECLGPAGLSQLQGLDAGGATGVAAVAELLAAHCRQAAWGKHCGRRLAGMLRRQGWA